MREINVKEMEQISGGGLGSWLKKAAKSVGNALTSAEHAAISAAKTVGNAFASIVGQGGPSPATRQRLIESGSSTQYDFGSFDINP